MGAAIDPPVLDISGLRTWFHTRDGIVRAVDGVSFQLARGEMLGVVGESGCGKSITALSVMGLVPAPAGRIAGGSIRLDGRELVGLDESAMCRVRGNEISMIFQEPMSSLNPVMRIGKQIAEPLRLHQGMDRGAARARAIEMLDLVQMPEARRRIDEYPHQLSGGMRQRVMIAIALACRPAVLIADEPTTALDVTIQAQILDLLAREQQRRHMAMILITHDLGVVAGRTDEVAVMYAGRVVERAPTPVLFDRMRMPYTEALLAAIPKLDAAPHTRLPAISGRPPDPTRPLPGCSFAPRCGHVDERCLAAKPPLSALDASGGQYACWHPLQPVAVEGA